MRNNSPTARKSRKPTCGTRAGAPLMHRTKRASRDRMQPKRAAFNAKMVGFCMTLGQLKTGGT